MKTFVIFICLISVCLVCYCYCHPSEEDLFQKRIHTNLNEDAPIIKYHFKKAEEYSHIKQHIIESDLFDRHNVTLRACGCSFTLDKSDILRGSSSLFSVKFDDKHRRMFMSFDHSRLGGSCFLKLKAYSLKDTPITIPRTNPMALLYMPSFMKDTYHFFHSPFAALPKSDGNHVDRYQSTVIHEAPKGVPKRTLVLHHVLHQVYAAIRPGRPLRVLVPVPFERFNTIHNNIGAILLLYDGESLETFAADFERKKYMAGVSNVMVASRLNKLHPCGQDIRTKIDVILTSFYSNTPLDFELYWSTQIKPTEPVYIGAYSRISDEQIRTHTVYTVSTSRFCPTKDMETYSLK